jgi:hypothetical protein
MVVRLAARNHPSPFVDVALWGVGVSVVLFAFGMFGCRFGQ